MDNIGRFIMVCGLKPGDMFHLDVLDDAITGLVIKNRKLDTYTLSGEDNTELTVMSLNDAARPGDGYFRVLSDDEDFDYSSKFYKDYRNDNLYKNPVDGNLRLVALRKDDRIVEELIYTYAIEKYKEANSIDSASEFFVRDVINMYSMNRTNTVVHVLRALANVIEKKHTELYGNDVVGVD